MSVFTQVNHSLRLELALILLFSLIIIIVARMFRLQVVQDAFVTIHLLCCLVTIGFSLRVHKHYLFGNPLKLVLDSIRYYHLKLLAIIN